MWTGSAWRPGAASRLWTQHALQSMSADLALRYGAGARIVFAAGPAAPALQRLCGAAGAVRVVASRRHEPAMRAADERTAATLEASGIQVRSGRAWRGALCAVAGWWRPSCVRPARTLLSKDACMHACACGQGWYVGGCARRLWTGTVAGCGSLTAITDR